MRFPQFKVAGLVIVLLMVVPFLYGSPVDEESFDASAVKLTRRAVGRLNEANQLRLHSGYTTENAKVLAEITCAISNEFVYFVSLAFEHSRIYDGVELPVVLSQREFEEFVENEIAYMKSEHGLSEPSGCWVRENLWELFRLGEGGFTVEQLTESQVTKNLELLSLVSCSDGLQTAIDYGEKVPEIMDALAGAIGGIALGAGNLPYAAIPFLGKVGVVASVGAGAWTIYRAFVDLAS